MNAYSYPLLLLQLARLGAHTHARARARALPREIRFADTIRHDATYSNPAHEEKITVASQPARFLPLHGQQAISIVFISSLQG